MTNLKSIRVQGFDIRNGELTILWEEPGVGGGRFCVSKDNGRLSVDSARMGIVFARAMFSNLFVLLNRRCRAITDPIIPNTESSLCNISVTNMVFFEDHIMCSWYDKLETNSGWVGIFPENRDRWAYMCWDGHKELSVNLQRSVIIAIVDYLDKECKNWMRMYVH